MSQLLGGLLYARQEVPHSLMSPVGKSRVLLMSMKFRPPDVTHATLEWAGRTRPPAAVEQMCPLLSAVIRVCSIS